MAPSRLVKITTALRVLADYSSRQPSADEDILRLRQWVPEGLSEAPIDELARWIVNDQIKRSAA